ncbi:MAG: hypothetical protein KIH08_11365 [Candidatus Freyarchaeota archaeon]|nr:hypothetical protein [Candidatus Jordarchaeia archaeon]MBS7270371.1 hypothetical protein [Candidatus Jordarchaeia archaeon]MBS7279820.1 hypothetical protein [Candidatus Jordarchaeia archaeon]
MWYWSTPPQKMGLSTGRFAQLEPKIGGRLRGIHTNYKSIRKEFGLNAIGLKVGAF